jgi:putative colanic acid biosynthesis UDP-glucose lipid carrier transferase
MKGGRIKRYIDTKPSIERIVDVVVISAGHLLACCLVGEHWNNASQATTAFAIVAFCLLAEIAGLYARRRDDDQGQGRLALYVWVATLPLLILFQLISVGVHWQTALVGIWAVIGGLGLYGWRLGARKLALKLVLGKRHSVAILGGTQAAERLCADIEARPWLRMRVAGIYDDRDPGRLTAAAAALRKGNCATLIEACRCGVVDTVIITLPACAQSRIQSVAEALGDTTATVFLLADVPALDLLNAPWTTIGGTALVGLDERPDNVVVVGLRRLVRLAFGRVFSSVALRRVRSSVQLGPVSPSPVVDAQTVDGNVAATNAPGVGRVG